MTYTKLASKDIKLWSKKWKFHLTTFSLMTSHVALVLVVLRKSYCDCSIFFLCMYSLFILLVRNYCKLCSLKYPFIISKSRWEVWAKVSIQNLKIVKSKCWQDILLSRNSVRKGSNFSLLLVVGRIHDLVSKEFMKACFFKPLAKRKRLSVVLESFDF